MTISQEPELCACGCGRPLPPRRPRYLTGHREPKHLGYVIEDRGYDSACWIEQGRAEKGYVIRSRSSGGVVTKRGAHVLAWERAHGQRVPRGMHVHHLCSQPRCSNPDHLALRSPAENVRESKAAKLTIEQVREIKRDRHLTAPYFAEKFGVSTWTIRNVRKGASWKGVE